MQSVQQPPLEWPLSTQRGLTAAGGVERLLTTIRSHLGMDVAFASQFVGDDVVMRYVVGDDTCPIQAGAAFSADHSYCKRIVDGRLPQLMPDTAAVPEAAALSVTTEVPVGAHLSVPIQLSDGSVFGTFCCFSHAADRSLNDRDLQTLRAFAEVAAGLIETDLRRCADHDGKQVRIQQVIERDQLAMAYQPIFGLNSGRMEGVECLARFADAELRPPNEWFSEAVEVGLGVDLEFVAVRAALRSLPYLPRDLPISVNVSPEAVISGRLVPLLLDAPPHRVVLEITEHAEIRDYNAVLDALQPLRNRASVAIDDAGAGFASLRHILLLKPDLIKLDTSLIQGLNSDPAKQALSKALVAFARELKCQVVAEGVETAEEMAILKGLGIDKAQGYYLSRPVPLAAIQHLVAG